MGMPWQKHSQISMKHRKKILMSEGDRNLTWGQVQKGEGDDNILLVWSREFWPH